MTDKDMTKNLTGGSKGTKTTQGESGSNLQSGGAAKKTQKSVLIVATVTSFITTFMGSALNLSIPMLEAEFSANAATIGWVITSYTLAVAALSVPIGKIADVTNRKMVFILGVTLFGGFSLVCAFAKSITFLIIFRVLQGFAAAMIFATNNAMLISAYPASQRGRVLGITTAAVYIGLSAGPVAGGFLNSYLGWESIFAVTSGIAVVALILALRGLPKTTRENELKDLDIAGTVLYILMITLSLYGLTDLSVKKYSWIILAAGILMGVLFVLRERKAEDPVIRVTMFSKDPTFTLSNLAALLNYGATFSISYLVSIYLQVVMGYGSQIAGLILISMPLVQALFSPMMGKLSDKIPPYKLASAGMGLSAVGLIMFVLVGTATPLWMVIGILVISGFGFALFSSPNTNAVMACVEKKDYSVANSILATMRTVGHSSSMAIVTIVVGFTMGTTALGEARPEELVHTMHICFIIFVALCVCGVFMSLKRKKRE